MLDRNMHHDYAKFETLAVLATTSLWNDWNRTLQDRLVAETRQEQKASQINWLPGAQRDIEVTDDDDGHGAAMLFLKSQVKLKPDMLSYTIFAGRLGSKHPTFTRKWQSHNLSTYVHNQSARSTISYSKWTRTVHDSNMPPQLFLNFSKAWSKSPSYLLLVDSFLILKPRTPQSQAVIAQSSVFPVFLDTILTKKYCTKRKQL